MMDEPRLKYKKLIAENWKVFTNTDDYKSIINSLGFNDYDVQIANITHKDEIVNMLKESYHKQLWITKLIGPIDQSEAVTMSIKNGRCFMIIHKPTQQIVASTNIDDYLDHHPNTHNNKQQQEEESSYYDKYNLPNIHMMEIANNLDSSIKRFVSNKFGNGNEIEYGNILYHCCSSTRYGLNNRAFSFIFSLIAYFAYKYIGYNNLIGDMVNTKMINIAKAFGSHIFDETDYSNYTFKDGTNINYYFDKLKLKQPNIDIEKFKKECKYAGLWATSNEGITMKQYKMLAQLVKKKQSKL